MFVGHDIQTKIVGNIGSFSKSWQQHDHCTATSLSKLNVYWIFIALHYWIRRTSWTCSCLLSLLLIVGGLAGACWCSVQILHRKNSCKVVFLRYHLLLRLIIFLHSIFLPMFWEYSTDMTHQTFAPYTSDWKQANSTAPLVAELCHLELNADVISNLLL